MPITKQPTQPDESAHRFAADSSPAKCSCASRQIGLLTADVPAGEKPLRLCTPATSSYQTTDEAIHGNRFRKARCRSFGPLQPANQSVLAHRPCKASGVKSHSRDVPTIGLNRSHWSIPVSHLALVEPDTDMSPIRLSPQSPQPQSTHNATWLWFAPVAWLRPQFPKARQQKRFLKGKLLNHWFCRRNAPSSISSRFLGLSFTVARATWLPADWISSSSLR